MTRPLLSGIAATIVGALGIALAAASPFFPDPWSVFVGIVGFIAAALAGLAARPPSVVASSPILQGAAFSLASGALTLLVQFYSVVPAGWPQSVAVGVAALLCRLTGQALPQLGSAPLQEPKSDAPASVSNLEEARRVLGGGR